MKFQTDYIITWDISKKDFPVIAISKLHADKGKLTVDVLEVLEGTSGVLSLRQLIDEAEIKKHQAAYEILLNAPNCNTCQKARKCEFVKWGEKVVYNCPHFEGGKNYE